VRIKHKDLENACLAPAGLAAAEMDKGCGFTIRSKLLDAIRRVYGMRWAINVASWRLRSPTDCPF